MRALVLLLATAAILSGCFWPFSPEYCAEHTQSDTAVIRDARGDSVSIAVVTIEPAGCERS